MNRVVNISESVYGELADMLAFNMRGKIYHCDEITVYDDGVEFTLSLVVMADYKTSHDEESYGKKVVVNVTPIWGEFHAIEGIEELDTDFSFDELKTYIL